MSWKLENELSLEGGLADVILGLGTGKDGPQLSGAWWAGGRDVLGARQEQPDEQGAKQDAWQGCGDKVRQPGPSPSLPGPVLGRPALSPRGLQVGWGQRPLLWGWRARPRPSVRPSHVTPTLWGGPGQPVLTRSDSASVRSHLTAVHVVHPKA